MVSKFTWTSLVRDITIIQHLNIHLNDANSFSIFSSNFNSQGIREYNWKQKFIDTNNNNNNTFFIIFHVQLLKIYLMTFLLKLNLKQFFNRQIKISIYLSFQKHDKKQVIAQVKKQLNVQCQKTNIKMWVWYREFYRFRTDFSESQLNINKKSPE